MAADRQAVGKTGRIAKHNHLAIAQRLFGDIDVCIGAAIRCARHVLPARTIAKAELQGSVFVAACPDPASWLPMLAARRLRGEFEQVLLVLAAEPAAAWFGVLAESQWSCCFLRGDTRPLMTAYHGARTEAFFATFESLGVVVRTHTR